MDAFDVLGLPPALDVDAKALEQRYRDLQRALHPDRFVQAGASERRQSLSRAVSVNDAYRQLRDELRRAEMVFARYGGAASEHDQGAADPELLMEMMELREQLAEARGSANAAERERLAELVRGKERAAHDELRAAHAQLTAARDDADRRPALDTARGALARLRYYRRFLDEVVNLEDAWD